jgi:hypothetical protein
MVLRSGWADSGITAAGLAQTEVPPQQTVTIDAMTFGDVRNCQMVCSPGFSPSGLENEELSPESGQRPAKAAAEAGTTYQGPTKVLRPTPQVPDRIKGGGRRRLGALEFRRNWRCCLPRKVVPKAFWPAEISTRLPGARQGERERSEMRSTVKDANCKQRSEAPPRKMKDGHR